MILTRMADREMSDSSQGGYYETAQSRRRRKVRKKRRYHEPITSYGLILYTVVNDQLKFLLYQRRDSFEYMDFLRGAWSCEADLPALFTNMSREERNRIKDFTFGELWDDLWVEHSCRIYRDGYPKAKRKYDQVKDLIAGILESTESQLRSPPWGFPKGKKNNYREDPIDCAIREFTEETRLPEEEIHIIDHNPYSESFEGSNHKSYCTHYFIARMNKPLVPTLIQTPHLIRKCTVSEEAISVLWCTLSEAIEKIHPRRQEILKRVVDKVLKIEKLTP